jgi:hypothetical protein
MNYFTKEKAQVNLDNRSMDERLRFKINEGVSNF